MASTRGRARGCRSVALPRVGDATASTSTVLATPPRAIETGEGSAWYNHVRAAIPIFADANERASDATTATAAMLTTLARVSVTGKGRAGSKSAGTTSVTCCGANQRAAPCDDTACCCGDKGECSTELGSELRSGKDGAAMSNGVGIALGDRDGEDMVYT